MKFMKNSRYADCAWILSMVATVGHAGVVQSFVAARTQKACHHGVCRACPCIL